MVEDDVMGMLVSDVVLASGSNYEKYSKNDSFHLKTINKLYNIISNIELELISMYITWTPIKTKIIL